MKVTINYGNTANIPDGIQYGGMKPFYNISVETDILPNEEAENVIQAYFGRLKAIVDGNVLRDMKNFKNIRYKCTCAPVFDGKHYVHAETCLSGSGDERK